jgi:uncharacterized protein YjbI with pentapeptide repeats
MSASHTSEPEANFVCDCDDQNRTACAGEPFFKEHEGKCYCVLHFPGNKKREKFQTAVQRKLALQDFDFSGVWFPDAAVFKEFNFSGVADFYFATFSAPADFSSAKFSSLVIFQGAQFGDEANFSSATFTGNANFAYTRFGAAASFTGATFEDGAFFLGTKFLATAHFYVVKFRTNAYFVSAKFGSDANFTDCQFIGEVNFKRAEFHEVASFWDTRFGGRTIFREAAFLKEVNFREAIFSDYLEFAGTHKSEVFREGSSLDLQFARIEKPDRVSFHTLTLHAHWFINVDVRSFDFINISWRNYGKAQPEIKLLNTVPSRHRLLVITCRNLAANAAENDRFRSASQFRRMAMDAERLENWRGFDFRKLNWWYWLASGYGESIIRAFLVLLGIWFIAALLYTRVGFTRWEPRLVSETDLISSKRDDAGLPLKFGRALTYSLGVMTLQKPEPRPATTAAQSFVLLETILGPVQAALLALAIRRKFMR